jgi:hypothetical protein
MLRYSCAIAHDLSGNDSLLYLFDRTDISIAKALKVSPPRSNPSMAGPEDAPWRPQRFFAVVARMLKLSINGEDWLRTLLYYTLLPAAFSDPNNGKDRGLVGLIIARILRFRQRVNESQWPNPEGNA